MTKTEKILSFDPSQPGLSDATVFGLPFSAEESEIIVIPVPWEVTVSYGAGASKGPEAILESSFQVDLLHQAYPELWKLGIFMDKAPKKLAKRSAKYKKLAQPIIERLESGLRVEDDQQLYQQLQKINDACADMVELVKKQTLHWLNQGKCAVLLGGDHSTPLGYYQALAEKYDSFAILHLDAHMDLRVAYEGFTFSHASVMYNSLQIQHISKIVQVGIRDFCEEEVGVVKSEGERVKVLTDQYLKEKEFKGLNWHKQCEEIIAMLPEKVCISFDIDGLQPWYCPNTGTPVPGGYSFEQAAYLFRMLADSGKEIIGFDLVEVAPGDTDWDGNVGARMLFHMCGALAKSRGMHTGTPLVF